MSSQGNEGDRMVIEEDQDEDPWSLLVDFYTQRTRFKAESELCKATNPSTPTLGISQLLVHVINVDNRLRHHISALWETASTIVRN
jgi:hypothetical protein